jgi:hypothetical protein
MSSSAGRRSPLLAPANKVDEATPAAAPDSEEKAVVKDFPGYYGAETHRLRVATEPLPPPLAPQATLR